MPSDPRVLAGQKRMLPIWLIRALRWQVPAAAAVFFVPAFFVAAVMPYRYWDSLAFSTWSRLIAQTGDVFPSGLIDLNLHRPLFYVTQGLAWDVFGYHEWLGRCLSVAFGAILVLCLWVLAGRVARDGDERELMRAFAVTAMVASSVFAAYVAAGMADVPVAAAAAAAGAALWSPRLGRAYAPLVALGAAATILAKPTGVLSLIGLVLATIVLTRGGEGTARLRAGLGGLGIGVAAALAYDLVQAHRLDESLYAFARAGNGDYWLAQGRAARVDALLRAAWLGEGVRLVVLFGLLYALARVLGGRTRTALAIGAAASILWSIGGPILADGGAPYPFDGLSLGLVAYMLVAGSLVAAAVVAPEDPLDRRVYAALLLWAAPGLIAWEAYRADAERFLTPAWPPLVLLATAALAVVARTLARARPAAALAPVLALTMLAVANVTSIDGLGHDGWRGLLDLGPSRWTDKAEIENYAYGPFSYELTQARENVGPDHRIVSNDGRLTYFFPGRVEVTYPTSCGQLRGARLFTELTSGESADFARSYGSPVDPLAWLQCKEPKLQLVGEWSGIYESFVVGGAPTRAPTPADCRISSYPAELYDAILAADVDYATARAVRERATKVGFQQVRIERTGCSTFRVVIRGFPATPAGQADFRHEAESTGFKVEFVPAVRYPEVAADVAPVG